MYNENEQRLKMIKMRIKSYKDMVKINNETAEKLLNMDALIEAKIYIEQAKTLNMVIEDLEFLLWFMKLMVK